jgi:hypothetical protein
VILRESIAANSREGKFQFRLRQNNRTLRKERFMALRTQISFRLDPYSAGRLAEGAARHALSEGAYARRLVVEALHEPDRLRDEVTRIRAELAALSERFARAVVALLVDAGKAEPEEAQAFVSSWGRECSR